MNAFIFVAFVCMNNTLDCTFFASTHPISKADCTSMKEEFLSIPKPVGTKITAAQCMVFDGKDKRNEI